MSALLDNRGRVGSKLHPGWSRHTKVIDGRPARGGVSDSHVTSVLPGSSLLSGTGLSKEAFLLALRTSSVVHISCHGCPNRDFPLLARLELEGSSRFSVWAHEIRNLDLSHMTLVVLAACRSSAGINGSVASLTHQFLLAGCKTALGTPIDIEDRATTMMFLWFYEALLAVDDPATALARAQAECRRSPNPRLADPSYWSRFHLWEQSDFPHCPQGVRYDLHPLRSL
jgi:CHAT domain-containing protein